ncbi:MAG: hypothetical protein MJ207_02445 [Bacilli bacterium]|nr:hypothetical protein [Bacilli bacterium]
MNEVKNNPPKKIRPYLSRDDRAMLREKQIDYKKKRRVSDYHIDAA